MTMSLHEAVKNNDLRSVQILLKNKIVDVNGFNKEGKTALNLAIQGVYEYLKLSLDGINSNNHSISIDIIDLLLRHGANARQKNQKDERTPLHLAASAGSIHVLNLLMEYGANADVNTRTSQGISPLYLAVRYKNLSIAKALLQEEAEISDSHNNADLFQFALDEEYWDIADELFKYNQLRVEKSKIQEYLTTYITKFDFENERQKNKFKKILERFKITLVLKYIGGILLQTAVRNGNNAAIKILLKQKAYVQVLDEKKNTLLHLVFDHNFSKNQNFEDQKCLDENIVSILDFLLELKVIDINAKNIDNETALHFAAKKGYPKVVSLLLEKGADIEVVNNNKKTALHLTAESGYEDVIDPLLEKKPALVNQQDDQGRTPLHIAAKEGHLGFVKVLLKKEKKIEEHLDSDQRTALHHAAEAGSSAIVEELIQSNLFNKNAKDRNGQTALHIAVQNKEKYKRSLFDSLIDPVIGNTVDNDEKTPLHIACENQNWSAVANLLKWTSIHARDKEQKTPLYYAITNYKLDFHSQILMNTFNLADILKNTNTLDGNQNTALHIILEYNKLEIILGTDFLKHIDINAKNKQGKTPLHLAAENAVKCQYYYAQSLLENGANHIPFDNDGNIPLHYLAKARYEPMDNLGRKASLKTCELLLDAKTGFQSSNGINTQNKLGKTPLHVAAENGNLEILEIFLHNKADLNILDNEGNSALHLVIQSISVCKEDSYQTLSISVIKIMLNLGAKINAQNKQKLNSLGLLVSLQNPLTDNTYKNLAKLLIYNGATHLYPGCDPNQDPLETSPLQSLQPPLWNSDVGETKKFNEEQKLVHCRARKYICSRRENLSEHLGIFEYFGLFPSGSTRQNKLEEVENFLNRIDTGNPIQESVSNNADRLNQIYNDWVKASK